MNTKRNVSSQGEILGLDSTKSGFLYHTSRAINDFSNDDLPALYVALTYLTQFQGVMFNRIRDPGYAYGFKLQSLPNEGQIGFQLYRSGDIFDAFRECVNIVVSISFP